MTLPLILRLVDLHSTVANQDLEFGGVLGLGEPLGKSWSLRAEQPWVHAIAAEPTAHRLPQRLKDLPSELENVDGNPVSLSTSLRSANNGLRKFSQPRSTRSDDR